MADMIRKLMPVEVKEVGERMLEIAGSTEDKDRMGDIIKASGWKLKNYKNNPIFAWVHDYTLPPIGRGIKVWVDKETMKLMFRVEFAGPEIEYPMIMPSAETVYKLYLGGFLHATSVGFIPLDWEGKSEENPTPKWEGNVFTSQELLELSAVPVPANANALVSARDSGIITLKEFEIFARQAEPVITPSRDSADTITKPEETEDYYRIPVKGEEGKHTDHRIRTIDIDKKKGIKALYCGEDKVIITYLFDKDKWDSMKDCQEWVDEHSKGFQGYLIAWVDFQKEEDFELLYLAYEYEYVGTQLDTYDEPPKPRTISQVALGDEFDYTIMAIKEVGINDEQMPTALNLASAILMRAPGSDIPVDILSKVGTVLNDRNEKRLHQIRQLAQDVMESTNATEDKGKKQVEPEPQLDPVVLARRRAIEVAEVANLVLAKLKGKRIR